MMNSTNDMMDTDSQSSLVSSQAANSMPTTPSYLVHTLDYFANTGTTICKLLKDQICVDLTFASRGRCFQIHKIILVSCSEYFMEELPKNPETGTIVVNWMDDDLLWPFIEYMYCGKTIVDSRLIDKFTPPVFLNKHQIKEINTTVTIADKKLPAAAFNDSSNSARKRGRPKLNEVNNDSGYVNMDISGPSQSLDKKPISLKDFFSSDMNSNSMVEISLSEMKNFANTSINQNSNVQIVDNVETNMFYRTPKREIYDVPDNYDDEEECGQAVQSLISVNDIMLADSFDTEQCTFLDNSVVDSSKENIVNNHDLIFFNNKDSDFQSSSLGNALRSAKAGESLLSQSVSTRYEENPLQESNKIQNESKITKRRRGRPRKNQSAIEFNQAPQLITYYDFAK